MLVSPVVAQAFNGRTATEWVKDLASADPVTRDTAVWALVTMGDRAVRPALRALDDERAGVREHAAVALGRLGAAASVAARRLSDLQQDPVPAVAKAAAVAAMRVQVDADRIPQLVEAIRGDDWDRQLAAADVLAALGPAAKVAALDAASHRGLLERHAKADEQEVRDAALTGLARLGDAEAKEELRRRSPWQAIDLDVPDTLRPRLEGVRLRLSQVRGNTLREVIGLLQRALGTPITVSAKVDPQVLRGRFQGGYIELIGQRPQALAVLSVVNGTFFSGDTLVPRFHADRIELVTPGESGLEDRR